MGQLQRLSVGPEGVSAMGARAWPPGDRELDIYPGRPVSRFGAPETFFTPLTTDDISCTNISRGYCCIVTQ